MKEIPPFPGTIEKRSRHKATLTPEQVRWCKKVYPHSTMVIMAQMMGISLRLTCEFFHQYGITKHKYRYKKLELNNWEKKIEIPKDIEQKATTQHSERKRMRRYIGEMIGELRVDKDLLKAVHEDDEPETIGPCMGKCCVNYECPQCYIQAKNPATGKYVITHRTQCNAMF